MSYVELERKSFLFLSCRLWENRKCGESVREKRIKYARRGPRIAQSLVVVVGSVQFRILNHQLVLCLSRKKKQTNKNLQTDYNLLGSFFIIFVVLILLTSLLYILQQQYIANYFFFFLNLNDLTQI